MDSIEKYLSDHKLQKLENRVMPQIQDSEFQRNKDIDS